MTIQEFKELCPEKAHLEGNALWSAMEDYFIKNNKIFVNKHKEPIFSHNGQKVKPGDILQIYKVDKVKEHSYRMIFFDFSDNEKKVEPTTWSTTPNKNYNKEIFQEEVTIESKNDILYVTVVDKIESITFISKYTLYNFLNFWYPNCIIKIK